MSIGQIYIFRFSGVCTAMLIFNYVLAATVLGLQARRLEPYFKGGLAIPYGTRQTNMNSTLGTDISVLTHMGTVVSSLAPLATGAAASVISGWF
jgi:hypothetical protein